MKRPPTTFSVDRNIHAYRDLTGLGDWEEACELAVGTRFEQVSAELLGAWRMASLSRGLPANVFEATASFDRNFTRIFEALDFLEPKILHHTLLPSRAKAAVRRVFRDCRKRLQVNDEKFNEVADEFLVNHWSEMVIEQPLLGAISSIESMAFTHTYFAFEHFVARLVQGVQIGEETPTPSLLAAAWPRATRKLEKDSKELLGESASACWADPFVRAARDARDAIAHRGGTIQDDQAEWPHDVLRVKERRVVIRAQDTQKLSEVLAGHSRTLLMSALAAVGEQACPSETA